MRGLCLYETGKYFAETQTLQMGDFSCLAYFFCRLQQRLATLSRLPHEDGHIFCKYVRFRPEKAGYPVGYSPVFIGSLEPAQEMSVENAEIGGNSKL